MVPGPIPKTASPIARWSTPSPTATTRPARSRPRKCSPKVPSKASEGSRPMARTTSRKFSPAASTATSTCPGPGRRREAGRRAHVSKAPGRLTSARQESDAVAGRVGVARVAGGGAGATGARPSGRRGWRSRPRPAPRPRRAVRTAASWSMSAVVGDAGRSTSCQATSGRSFIATRNNPHNGARTRSSGTGSSPTAWAPAVTTHTPAGTGPGRAFIRPSTSVTQASWRSRRSPPPSGSAATWTRPSASPRRPPRQGARRGQGGPDGVGHGPVATDRPPRAVGGGGRPEGGRPRPGRHQHRLARGPVGRVVGDDGHLGVAGRFEDGPPGVRRQEGMGRPGVEVGEPPPALGDAEDDVEPPEGPGDLDQHQPPAGGEGGRQPGQRRARVGRGVHHVGPDHQVEGARSDALGLEVVLHVDHGRADAHARQGLGEPGRHVGERVLRPLREHGPDVGRRAPGPPTHLEDPQRAIPAERADHLGHQGVAEPGRGRVPVEVGQQVGALVGEEHLGSVETALKDGRQSCAAPAEQGRVGGEAGQPDGQVVEQRGRRRPLGGSGGGRRQNPVLPPQPADLDQPADQGRQQPATGSAPSRWPDPGRPPRTARPTGPSPHPPGPARRSRTRPPPTPARRRGSRRPTPARPPPRRRRRPPAPTPPPARPPAPTGRPRRPPPPTAARTASRRRSRSSRPARRSAGTAARRPSAGPARPRRSRPPPRPPRARPCRPRPRPRRPPGRAPSTTAPTPPRRPPCRSAGGCRAGCRRRPWPGPRPAPSGRRRRGGRDGPGSRPRRSTTSGRATTPTASPAPCQAVAMPRNASP